MKKGFWHSLKGCNIVIICQATIAGRNCWLSKIEWPTFCACDSYVSCQDQAPIRFSDVNTLSSLHTVNLKSWRGNMLTPTNGTAARSAQASPLFERKSALLTGGWVHIKGAVVY